MIMINLLVWSHSVGTRNEKDNRAAHFCLTTTRFELFRSHGVLEMKQRARNVAFKTYLTVLMNKKGA